MKRFSIQTIYGWIQKPFREHRLKLYREVIRPTPETTILDVGGSPWFWTGLAISGRVTVLNPAELSDEVKAAYPAFKCIGGDGCNLSFPDASFDVVFPIVSSTWATTSGRRRSRPRCAGWEKLSGCRRPRAGISHRAALPVAIHSLLPRWLQRRTVRYFTIFGLMTKPSQTQIENLLNEIRLLKYWEMKELFPDCEIYREKFLGLTKSYVALRRSQH